MSFGSAVEISRASVRRPLKCGWLIRFDIDSLASINAWHSICGAGAPLSDSSHVSFSFAQAESHRGFQDDTSRIRIIDIMMQKLGAYFAEYDVTAWRRMM